MGTSPAHAAVPREGPASWSCCPLWAGFRRPGARPEGPGVSPPGPVGRGASHPRGPPAVGRPAHAGRWPGVSGTRARAPGLPGPFSAPLGWPRPLGEKRRACRPGKRAHGSLSANAAMFSGVSRPRRGLSRISGCLPRSSPHPGELPRMGRGGRRRSGGHSPFCPESPAGPFSLPGGSPGGVRGRQASTGASCGHPGHILEGFPPSAAGVMRPSRFFPRPPEAGAAPLFALRGPQGRFSPRGGSPGSVQGGRAGTRASCGRLGHVPGGSGPFPLPQFFRLFPLSQFFNTLI